ncbi:Beta-glucosidase [Penicillium lagena]|uniref:Beta-glucosidase n=1 Tax=Penicillium lagena TaxID=94218 RepID=UPI00254199E0|nr:Beta-glucosidase [Penicillium lagena]KAJ5604699.1 Beta-glucosidase [Penicillium lagena]
MLANLLLLLFTTTLVHGTSYHPPVSPGYGEWAAAYEKARHFVCQLTLTEKVNLTTGVGTGQTVGYSTGIIPRLNFRGFAGDDSPTGVRGADYSSAFAAGLNLAMSWDRELIYTQSYANGAEHKAKGDNSIMAPVVGPLGRAPEAGRNFEGFSPDPYLSGIAFGEAVAGMQASGAIAVGKHFILYEQEHFREVVEWNEWHAGPNITEPYSSNCDDRTFHELYLFPWYDGVKNGLAGVMCSYNQVNNTQVCQSDHLLNDILKGELGFQGYVTSDDGSQHSGVDSALGGMDMTGPGETSPNGVSGLGESFWGPNLTLSVLNGSVPEWRLDDMATRIMASYYYLGQDEDYPELNFASGDFDTYGYEYPKAELGWRKINDHRDVRKNHSAIIRKVGSNSVVLLKNTNNTLPLKSPKQIAVIGEDAGPNKYGPNGCPDRACDLGTVAMGWGSGSTNFPYLVDPLSAIQQRALADDTVVQYVLDNWAKDQIGVVSSQASVCLTFINAISGEGYLEVDKNYGDRNNLTAWKDGDNLVKQVAANCSQTVVVVHAPGPILMEEWIENPNVTAVLFAGFPGQESGNSIADVLYGDVNPSGKLPWTVGKSRKDYGTDVLYEPNGLVPQLDFNEGLFIDYRYFDKHDIEPRFEFGFGLSYTTFAYSKLRIESVPVKATKSLPYSATSSTADPTICPSTSLNPSDYTFPSTISSLTDYIYPYLAPSMTVTTSLTTPTVPVERQTPQAQGGDPSLYDIVYKVHVDIKNTGEVAGQEVSQLYLDLGNGEPKRQLRGFQKTMIQPGDKQAVIFELRRRDISIWDVVQQKWVEVTKLGTNVKVSVGASSRDLQLHGVIPAR